VGIEASCGSVYFGAAIEPPKHPARPDGCLAIWNVRSSLDDRGAARPRLRGHGDDARTEEAGVVGVAPGVLAYLDGEPVGWAGIAPRSELHPFEHSRKIPHVDDLPAWSLWCLRVRPGYRGRGVTRALIEGGVDYARENGAPVVESYPVDNGGGKVDTTMAFVGTRAMFERAGFAKVADTDSVSGGIPRIVMRRALD
jgi:GNAT superfamily N-acetyltransferase